MVDPWMLAFLDYMSGPIMSDLTSISFFMISSSSCEKSEFYLILS